MIPSSALKLSDLVIDLTKLDDKRRGRDLTPSNLWLFDLK